jgi:hypothetical protein
VFQHLLKSHCNQTLGTLSERQFCFEYLNYLTVRICNITFELYDKLIYIYDHVSTKCPEIKN